MTALPFLSSARTFGIELELQLIDTRTFDLATDAGDLLRRLEPVAMGGDVKPEITQSMIEISTTVHSGYESVTRELVHMRDALTTAALRMNLRIAGGGAHAFHQWRDRRIFPTDRFKRVSEQYGYLAKLFTVFGQHIHVGCIDGDEAIYLTRALTRYLPQFIALSASSPFYQMTDTAFDSSRSNIVSAFPLSGIMPPLTTWAEFEVYFAKLKALGIVESMKDFYWDVRPKPEFGTVEIRVCDTPLTVEHAAVVAVYAHALVGYLLDRPRHLHADVPLVYSYNRFQACRYGYQGSIIDAECGTHTTIAEDTLATIDKVRPYVCSDGADALRILRDRVASQANGARWLREAHSRTMAFEDTVRAQSDLWMGRPGSS